MRPSSKADWNDCKALSISGNGMTIHWVSQGGRRGPQGSAENVPKSYTAKLMGCRCFGNGGQRFLGCVRLRSEESDMASPWLKKNPFMSMWLSAANAAAGSARGLTAAAMQQQTNAAIAQANKQVADFWTAMLTGSPKPAAKRRTRR